MKSAAVVASGKHGLGILPVFPLFARKEKPRQYLPTPEFYQVARVNKRIYNLCSEIDESLRGQAFSTLIYPGALKGKDEKGRI